MAKTVVNSVFKRENFTNTVLEKDIGAAWDVGGTKKYPWTVDTTDLNIRQVTKIVWEHYHTQTGGTYERTLQGYFDVSGITGYQGHVTSDKTASKFSSSTSTKFTSTFYFTETSEDAENGKYTEETGRAIATYLRSNPITIRLRSVSGNSNTDLYGRATSSNPMKLTIYYYDKSNEPRVKFFEQNDFVRTVDSDLGTASFSIPVNYALTGESDALTDESVQSLNLYYTTDGLKPSKNSQMINASGIVLRSSTSAGSIDSASANYTFNINAGEYDSLGVMIEYVYGDENDVIYTYYSAELPTNTYQNIPLHLSGTGNGVAIGSYSTATADEKKFESFYPMYVNLIGEMRKLEDEFYFKEGDILRVDKRILPGLLTSSSTEILFTIDTPKRLTKIKSLTIDYIAVLTRSATGDYLTPKSTGTGSDRIVYYQNGNYTSYVNIAQSGPSIKSDNHINIRLQSPLTYKKGTTSDKATNNSSVIVDVDAIIILHESE